MLRQESTESKLVAGGQSLVPMMAMRLTRPARLIDINEIAALKSVVLEDLQLRTGACVRQCVIEHDDTVATKIPLLRRALAWVGHVQTRNRGTVGGSVAHADPAAELPLVAQVLSATMVLQAHSGVRSVAAAEFFLGPLTTALEAHECLAEIRWPVWNDRRLGCSFLEVSRRHGDFALVAAAAQIAVDDDGKCLRVSFGLTGGGSTPLAFESLAANLAGLRFDDDNVRSVAREAARLLDPGSDLHASAAYRTHLAEVLAARALRAAYDDARSKT